MKDSQTEINNFYKKKVFLSQKIENRNTEFFQYIAKIQTNW